MTRVCHISTVHCVPDNRILHRQCRSLREAGYSVTWVAKHNRGEVLDGVNIVAVRPAKTRVRRWLFSGWEAFQKALKTKAAIYHFHDPEFMLHALLLRMMGKQVIYDIHENYVSSVSQKYYIPAALGSFAGNVAGFAEKLLSCPFERVIAERYYEERFPNAVKVLNYPRISGDDRPVRRSETNLLYTGNSDIHRGAMIHARLPALVEGVRVKFIGKCPTTLHRKMVDANSSHLDRLEFIGVGRNVPHEQIVEHYRSGEWLAGLAIFAPNQHLEKKELTKFFEYMQHGIPIIASNFPTWRRLVEDNHCGICVDPTKDGEIAEAVRRLRDDPQLWEAMSRNGIKTVREQYSWASQEKSLLGLYEKLSSQPT